MAHLLIDLQAVPQKRRGQCKKELIKDALDDFPLTKVMEAGAGRFNAVSFILFHHAYGGEPPPSNRWHQNIIPPSRIFESYLITSHLTESNAPSHICLI